MFAAVQRAFWCPRAAAWELALRLQRSFERRHVVAVREVSITDEAAVGPNHWCAEQVSDCFCNLALRGIDFLAFRNVLAYM